MTRSFATRNPSRRMGAVLLFLAAAALLGACGSPSSEPGGAATPAGASPASSIAPNGVSPAPGSPYPTPPTVAGLEFPLGLEPPDPGEGPVPPAEPPTPAVIGTLELGGAVELGRGSAGPAGGTITIDKPGDPLDGVVVDIPAGTYADSVAFTLSQRPIAGSTFEDAGITPITPLLTVSNGDAVATGAPVTVRLPASVPDGATATAFYYDAKTGAISPLAVADQSATSITVATAHFSDIFAALVDAVKLPETADSGFRPGVDDWQFTNYGSYVAPGGHCEGQSVTALWYYATQRSAGAPALFGLLDNNGSGTKTPNLWADDSEAYRFASAVQADPIALPDTYEAFTSLRAGSGAVQFEAFRLAIAVTGQPQLISIADANGEHGHAMIVYRVDPKGLYVADPNYPGMLRTIRYDEATGKLGPYNSGSNAASIAAGEGTVYTQFALVPRWASVTDAAIARHFADVQGRTSGDAIFPTYRLEAWKDLDENGDDIWVPLVDGYTTPEPTLRVRIVTPKASDQATMAIYFGAVDEPVAGWDTELTIDLTDGANELGFYELGAVGTSWEYVDFVRLTVTKGRIDINGRWDGSVTFSEIFIDEEAMKSAEDQGCSAELLESLKGRALPMTIAFTVDEAGSGSAQMTIDMSELLESATEPQADTLDVTYVDDKITFELGATCQGDGCAMTGVVSERDGLETIDGTLTLTGEGYAAGASWSVFRSPEN